jgi:NuA3 HAT complex component NTO1
VAFNVFEILIDRLEKELMIRLEASQGGGHSSSERLGVRGLNTNAEHVTIDEAVCAVCQYDDSHDDNLIIVCDGCDVAVHQVCYGVKKVPAGTWLCDACSHSLRRNPKPPAPACCLCHKKGGAFKTTDDGRWAHIMCAIWIPQTCVQNNETMSPIVGIDRVPKDTWLMLCDFCRCQGACIRCSEPGCTHAFHPVCARSNGCVMDIGEGDRGEIVYRATCPQHSDFAGSASSFAFERRSQEVVLQPQTIRDLVPIQKVRAAALLICRWAT